MATPQEIEEEQQRARYVRMIVDFTSNLIMQSRMARHEAETLVGAARAKVLQLFPGRDDTYELLYAPRFRRLVNEFTHPEAERSGQAVVIPFRRGSR